MKKSFILFFFYQKEKKISSYKREFFLTSYKICRGKLEEGIYKALNMVESRRDEGTIQASARESIAVLCKKYRGGFVKVSRYFAKSIAILSHRQAQIVPKKQSNRTEEVPFRGGYWGSLYEKVPRKIKMNIGIWG